MDSSMGEDEIMQKYSKLIHWTIRMVASNCLYSTEDYEDMEQIAKIALFRAIKKFNPDRGVKFITYATTIIKRDVINANERVKRRGFGRGKLDNGLVYSLDADKEDDSDYSHYANFRYLAEDKTAKTGDDLLLIMGNQQIVSILLEQLTEKEASILRMRYLEDPPNTLDRIGEVFGISKERVRQIQNEAIRKLKEFALKNSFHE